GNELQQQQVETDTSPQTGLTVLEQELRAWRGEAVRAARLNGARIVAVGTSPVPGEPHRVPSPRYRFLAEKFGMTTSEQMVCGCHVHVSVTSLEEAVGVLDRIRVWLPTLLAITANSPFWRGRDSAYSSYRSQVMGRWPSAGPTELFGSAEAYRERVAEMKATGVVLDEGMVYFDARASHSYPTVELRSADVCMHVEDAVLLGALARALVETTGAQWAAGEPPAPVPVSMLRLASWQAGREGLDGDLLDPYRSRPRPAADVVESLLDHVRPALTATGDLALVEDRLSQVLSRGNGARRQRTELERTGRLADVVADAARVTAGQDS
ncbi:glutamate--cysteine ligase, partial [Georgenia sp. 10Sc9-8]|nr:glutamate--cysteine ligase [Georgenia halotolerans]